MTRFLISILLTSGSLLSAQAVSNVFSAQEYQLAHSLFSKVRSDLQAAQKDVGGGPALGTARADLSTLEGSWNQADFDSRQMANTISAVRALANDNRLLPGDRAALSDDLSRLLDFQKEYY